MTKDLANTLELMITVTVAQYESGITSLATYGKGMTQIADDYIRCDDLVRARACLLRVPESYFTSDMPLQAIESGAFGEVVARVVETFGLEMLAVFTKASA